MMYASETWAIKKEHENKVDVVKMKMLIWICGVTRKHRIRKKLVKGTAKVDQITSKMQEKRLNWYGLVIKRNEK